MNKIDIFTNTHLIQIQRSSRGWTLYTFEGVGQTHCTEMLEFGEFKNALSYAREQYFAGSEWC